MYITTKIHAPGLRPWLKSAQQDSGLNVTDFVAAAGFSSAYWYRLLDGTESGINESTLKKIEQAAGKQYPRDGES